MTPVLMTSQDEAVWLEAGMCLLPLVSGDTFCPIVIYVLYNTGTASFITKYWTFRFITSRSAFESTWSDGKKIK